MGIGLKAISAIGEFNKSCFSGIIRWKALKYAERMGKKWIELLESVVRSRESFFICRWEIFGMFEDCWE